MHDGMTPGLVNADAVYFYFRPAKEAEEIDRHIHLPGGDQGVFAEITHADHLQTVETDGQPGKMPEEGQINVFKVYPGIHPLVDLLAGDRHYFSLKKKRKQKSQYNEDQQHQAGDL
jgi:hypothetical protein